MCTMSDLHMQAMHDELAALAAISAVSAEREQRTKKKRCGFAERGGEMQVNRVRSENGIVLENKLHTQHELSSFARHLRA